MSIDYSNALATPENVIKGKKYRFTVLTPRLIRMEYSEDGTFEDHLTTLVLNRKTAAVEYTKKEDKKYLEITTSYFRLTYEKNKPFYSGKFDTMKYLKVELLNTDKIWYYGHPEIRNYGSPNSSLDDNKGKLKLKKGLYSVDGFASIKDENDLILENGTVKPRENKNIDLYLFLYLKDFALCLKDYFLITGSPALIPRYALGNWWSKNEEYNDLSLKDLVDDFKNKEIPLSILLLDKKWHIDEYKDKITYEELGYKSYNAALEEAYKNEMKNLKDGEYSKEPVKTSYGYHIVYRIDQKEKPSLEDIKDQIKEEIADEKISNDKNLYYVVLDKMRENANLKFEDTVLKDKYDNYMSQYK